jgi:hypothetical protein
MRRGFKDERFRVPDYFTSVQDVTHTYAQTIALATMAKITGPTPMEIVAALTSLDARTAIERSISVPLRANPEVGFSAPAELSVGAGRMHRRYRAEGSAPIL